jgi:hypothetical protein
LLSEIILYLAYKSITNTKISMKKLKRNELKKIEGGVLPSMISCDEYWNCPIGLCCTAGLICRDPKHYGCI